MKISIDTTKCRQCKRCITVCPQDVMIVEDGIVTARHADRCIECGHCVDVCEHSAIEHEAFPHAKVHKIQTDLLPSSEQLMELIRSRRSNRQISDKAIPAEWLDQIMEAARYAPTAENSRKVRLHLITDEKQLWEIEHSVMGYFMRLCRPLMWQLVKAILRPFCKGLYAQTRELLAMNDRMEYGERPATINCKAMLIITAPRGYRFGYQDCNLAYQNASLMAQSLGITQIYLGFVQVAMGLFSKKKTARLLGIPQDHQPYAIMALGIPKFRYANYTEHS